MLGKWFTQRASKPPKYSPICPEVPFQAIGDIHGRYDLACRALEMAQSPTIICVGDYIDRGDHSADVLRLLHGRPDIICLMGNHEEMMLNFLEDPQRHGPRWLRYGGLQTLASFGVAGLSDTTTGPALDAACATLKSAMGPELLRWIRHLPAAWQSGNVAVVHAGADPAVPMDAQTRNTLLWGHPDFGKVARNDDTWVLHGHTIVDAPIAANGLISIDTGAYATGRLTIASVSGEGVSFDTV